MCAILPVQGQDNEAYIKYGNMDSWVVRKVKESGIIGGNTKTLYEVAISSHTIASNKPYHNMGGSPATSNVMAKVMGVVKTNNSVVREKRGNGYCAKLVTHIEQCKVLGMMNIKVLAAGSMFLGNMREPITGTKNGQKYLNFGIPFTHKPKAIRFDYKFKSGGTGNRIRQTGFSKKSSVAGRDYGVAMVLLQKRTENARGEIVAKRLGTMVVRFGKTTAGWVNDATFPIHYGDMRHNDSYNASSMGLRSSDYAVNSKGKSVPVRETGWGSPGETPTHIVVQFASSHGGAYVGTPGNTLWIDNVRLVY